MEKKWNARPGTFDEPDPVPPTDPQKGPGQMGDDEPDPVPPTGSNKYPTQMGSDPEISSYDEPDPAPMPPNGKLPGTYSA